MRKHLWYVFYGKWVRVIEVQCGYSNHFQIQLPRQPPAILLLLRLLLQPPQPPPQLQVGDNFIPVYILLSKGFHYLCTKGMLADILGPCTQIPPTSLDELIFYVIHPLILLPPLDFNFPGLSFIRRTTEDIFLGICLLPTVFIKPVTISMNH